MCSICLVYNIEKANIILNQLNGVNYVKYMNILQNQIKCVECGNTKLIKDFVKKEVYCSKCGLVLMDTSISTLKDFEYISQHMEQESKNKKTRKIQHSRWEKFLFNFL